MENKQGTIKAIAEKSGDGKKGPYTMWTFEMTDGMKYTTFDEKIGNAGFKAGDNVELSGEQNGKYWNMKEMKKTDKQIEQKSFSNDREKSIIAQTLTKCFSEVMASNPTLSKDTVKANILEAYKFFLSSQ